MELPFLADDYGTFSNFPASVFCYRATMWAMAREDFIKTTFLAAKQSGHIFPEYAVCEAALESDFGSSELALQGNNLFGMKQHIHPVYGTLNLPTHEWSAIHHAFEPTEAEWVKYPDLPSCFSDRMDTLKRLSVAKKKDGVTLEYPHYAAALAATDGETFIREVSQHWSSDPKRAIKVLAIYAGYSPVIQAAAQSLNPDDDGA